MQMPLTLKFPYSAALEAVFPLPGCSYLLATDHARGAHLQVTCSSLQAITTLRQFAGGAVPEGGWDLATEKARALGMVDELRQLGAATAGFRASLRANVLARTPKQESAFSESQL